MSYKGNLHLKIGQFLSTSIGLSFTVRFTSINKLVNMYYHLQNTYIDWSLADSMDSPLSELQEMMAGVEGCFLGFLGGM